MLHLNSNIKDIMFNYTDLKHENYIALIPINLKISTLKNNLLCRKKVIKSDYQKSLAFLQRCLPTLSADQFSKNFIIQETAKEILSISSSIQALPTHLIIKDFRHVINIYFCCDLEYPDHNGAVLDGFLKALSSKEAVVVVPRSIIQCINLPKESKASRLKSTLKEIHFRWRRKHIYKQTTGELLLFIPSKFSLEDLGMNSKEFVKVKTPSEIYESEKKRATLIDFEKIFQKRTKIRKRFQIHGHGEENNLISGLSIDQFREFLKILDRENVEILKVHSCSAGGINTLYYSYLNKIREETLPEFPIIIESIGDFFTRSHLSLRNFQDTSLALKRPYIKAFERIKDTGFPLDEYRNFSKIRYPIDNEIPSGFRPIIENSNAFCITYVRSRQSLIEKVLSKDKSNENSSLVINDCSYLELCPIYIQVPIQIKGSLPLLISMMGSPSQHGIQFLKIEGSLGDFFLHNAFEYKDFNGELAFFFKTLVDSDNIWKNVVFYFNEFFVGCFGENETSSKHFYYDLAKGTLESYNLIKDHYDFLIYQIAYKTIPYPQALKASSGGQENTKDLINQFFDDATFSKNFSYFFKNLRNSDFNIDEHKKFFGNNSEIFQPLFETAILTQLEKLSLFLLEEEKVNANRSIWGLSPLSWAVLNKNLTLIKKLRLKGAKLEKGKIIKAMPIVIALDTFPEAVDALINDNNEELSFKHRKECFIKSFKDRDLLIKLVSHGILLKEDYFDFSEIPFSTFKSFPSVCQDLLLETNYADSYLISAIRERNQLLVEKFLNNHIRDKSLITFLLESASNGTFEILEKIFYKKKEKFSQIILDQSLMRAAETFDLKKINFLLEHGASPLAKNQGTPFAFYAVFLENFELIQKCPVEDIQLLSHNAEIQSFLDHLIKNNLPIFKKLLEKGLFPELSKIMQLIAENKDEILKVIFQSSYKPCLYVLVTLIENNKDSLFVLCLQRKKISFEYGDLLLNLTLKKMNLFRKLIRNGYFPFEMSLQDWIRKGKSLPIKICLKAKVLNLSLNGTFYLNLAFPYPKIFRQLILAGVDPNRRLTPHQLSPLEMAVVQEEAHLVALSKDYINSNSINTNSPLVQGALKMRKLNGFRMLILYGYDPFAFGESESLITKIIKMKIKDLCEFALNTVKKDWGIITDYEKHPLKSTLADRDIFLLFIQKRVFQLSSLQVKIALLKNLILDKNLILLKLCFENSLKSDISELINHEDLKETIHGVKSKELMNFLVSYGYKEKVS